MLAAETVGAALVTVIVVLGALQLGLFVWALIDLVKRPRPSLLPRWAWIIVVVFLEILGSILYLTLGRRRPEIAERTEALVAAVERSGEQQTEHAIETLYGPKPDE